MESVMLSIIVCSYCHWRLARTIRNTDMARKRACIDRDGAGVEGEQTTTAWARAKNSGSQSRRQQTA